MSMAVAGRRSNGLRMLGSQYSEPKKSLQLITGIVEQYGGTVHSIDWNTHTLDIEVPKEHEVECAMKAQEVIERMV